MEVGVGAGGMACWGLLSCLEVVDALHNYKDPTTTDAHALHTAPLYAYARDKVIAILYCTLYLVLVYIVVNCFFIIIKLL